MERRQFFRWGLGKAIQTANYIVNQAMEPPTGRWFRPPYAQQESAFLLSCTRCDKCIIACPYGILFALPPTMGAQVAATPAMNLSSQGCHLCADWPCVAACQPHALQLPSMAEGATPLLPRLAQVKIDPARCLPYLGPECGACGSVCPIPDAIQWQGSRPTVEASLCVGCALCLEACITTPKAVLAQPLRDESYENPPLLS